MNSQDAFVVAGQGSEANANFYRECGYLVAPELLSREEVAELKRETVEIFRGNRIFGVKPTDTVVDQPGTCK